MVPRATRATEVSVLLVPARPVSRVAAASLLGNFSDARFVAPVPASVERPLLFRRFELELASSPVLLAATRGDSPRVVRTEGSAGRFVPTFRAVLPSGTEFIFCRRRDDLMYLQVHRSQFRSIRSLFVQIKPQREACH